MYDTLVNKNPFISSHHSIDSLKNQLRVQNSSNESIDRFSCTILPNPTLMSSDNTKTDEDGLFVTSDSTKSDQTASDNNTDNTKKRSNENTSSDSEPKNKKTKTVLKFIPWKYLTYNVLKQCIRFADPYTPPGKAAMVKIIFDYRKFAQLVPECPEVKPPQSKILYTDFPYLESAFGYSPHVSEDGKVTNQLRFGLDNPVTEESVRFRGDMSADEIKEGVDPYGLKAWDQVFIEAVAENLKKWETIPVVKKILKAGDPVQAVKDMWKSTAREGKAALSDYVQFRLYTQVKNEKQGILEDPYTAYLKVWNKDGKMLKKKLERHNAVDYEGDGIEIILDKGMYATGMISVDHINFTPGDLGLTFTAHGIKIARREDFEESHVGMDEDDTCPI